MDSLLGREIVTKQPPATELSVNFPYLTAAFRNAGSSEPLLGKTRDHPLCKLLRDKSDVAAKVATRTEDCARRIWQADAPWLVRRAKVALQDADWQNVSAALGEIRAYGELIWVWGEKVKAGGRSGIDFKVECNGVDVGIEVNTPQQRPDHSQRVVSSSERQHISVTISEVFPFGRPERMKDNVQGEAVSKLAAIKGNERQLGNQDISVLWIDLLDPGTWPCGFGQAQFLPVTCFREELTTGAAWSAFYARKDDPIYDGLSVLGLPSHRYSLEYDGRFSQNTRLDFVVADILDDQIVFENPNHKKLIPDDFYRDLHRLFKFSVEFSWLDWPERGSLSNKIQSANLDSHDTR